MMAAFLAVSHAFVVGLHVVVSLEWIFEGRVWHYDPHQLGQKQSENSQTPEKKTHHERRENQNKNPNDHEEKTLTTIPRHVALKYVVLF
jgi:hypothetical protein